MQPVKRGCRLSSRDMASRAPAPHPLRVVQDLVNTADLESGTDELADTSSAATWLVQRGLLPEGSRVTAQDRRNLVEIREALRSLLMANTGGPLDPAAVETLDRAGARAPIVVHVTGDGSAVLSPAGRGLPGAIAQVLAAMSTAMQDGTWHRLKVCADDVCRWAFYDHSRNRSGAWCSMDVCGNRAKARAFRERRSHRP